MNIQIGSVVKALAGREKNSFYVAVGIHDGFVFIADGKERKLQKPKRKNIKHISPTNTVFDTDGLTMNLEELERDAIERAMRRADGNISRAAELLGITRYTLYRKLNK